MNNVKKVDFHNFTLRINKNFKFNRMSLDLFVEIDNLLNHKYLDIGRFYSLDAFYGSATGTNSDPQFGPFWDSHDYYAYMESLHLPKSDAYDNIVGDDKIGDYRDSNVEYQPIKFYNEQLVTGDEGVIYYDRNSHQYLEYVDGGFQEVDKKRMDKILKDKAYIDMPNASTYWFLDPRRIFYGIRLSFNIK